MLLEDLFDRPEAQPKEDYRKNLFETYGIFDNPFPSAGQTSGHPHMDLSEDKRIEQEIKSFYHDRKSHVIPITASQGIGKTNLLNAYESALKEKLSATGFFIIRYVADPEPSFDPLIRSIFENLGENHLQNISKELAGLEDKKADKVLTDLRTVETKQVLKALREASKNSDDKLTIRVSLAYQWLLGLPVRKSHREELGVQYRLDTVESKTRALRDIVSCSASLKKLEGIFLMLDELEKQDSSLSKTSVLRYLSALRALIDALPRYLFLMVALTTDALDRYREMLPALRGRLANEVQLRPLENEDDALTLCNFYINEAKKRASSEAKAHGWNQGDNDIVADVRGREIFQELSEISTIEGVRQRDYLNALYREVSENIKL